MPYARASLKSASSCKRVAMFHGWWLRLMNKTYLSSPVTKCGSRRYHYRFEIGVEMHYLCGVKVGVSLLFNLHFPKSILLQNQASPYAWVTLYLYVFWEDLWLLYTSPYVNVLDHRVSSKTLHVVILLRF